MLATSTINVVERKELSLRLSAARAFATIAGD